MEMYFIVSVAFNILFIIVATISVILVRQIIYKNREMYYKKINEQIEYGKKETRDEILNKISVEIHDNLGQITSLIKFYAQSMIKKPPIDYHLGLTDIAELAEKLNTELKSIESVIISSEYKSIVIPLKTEIEYINRTRVIKGEVIVVGKVFEINSEHNILIFRIAQEGINNALKHSKASELKILLKYDIQRFTMVITDNGIGFNPQKVLGNGINNMKNRAHLLGGELKIDHQNGTIITLNIPVYNGK